MCNSKTCEIESEPEEHSLSLSQHSSPSQSDQEQTPVKKSTHSVLASQEFEFPLLKQQNQISSNGHSKNVISNQVNPKNFLRRNPQDFQFLREQPNSEQHLHVVQMGRHEAQHLATEQKPVEAGHFQNLVKPQILLENFTLPIRHPSFFGILIRQPA